MERIRQLDYCEKVTHPQYRHLEAHGKGKKKYYYQMQGLPLPNGLTEASIVMKTGSTYEGTVNSNNERHGWGVFQVVFGGRYEGQWKDGFKHGSGSLASRRQQLLQERQAAVRRPVARRRTPRAGQSLQPARQAALRRRVEGRPVESWRLHGAVQEPALVACWAAPAAVSESLTIFAVRLSTFRSHYIEVLRLAITA